MFTTAILIAAGRSRGRHVPRPLRRRGGMTFLELAVEQALLSCADEVIVVLGKRIAPARELLEPRPRLRVVIDEKHTEKRAKLLESALHSVSQDTTTFFVEYADDRAPSSTEIDQFLSAAIRAHKPLVLRDDSEHALLPVLVDRALKSELLSNLDDETLRRVVERDPSRLCLVRAGAVTNKTPAKGTNKGAGGARPVRRRARS